MPDTGTRSATRTKTTKKTTTKKRPTRKRAATSKARPAGTATLRVKQVRSGIGRAETYRRTLRALGLRHYQHEITVTDSPSVRGMLHKVRHLVQVRPGEA